MNQHTDPRAERATIVCWVCQRDVPIAKLDGRRCANRTNCYRAMASRLFTGGVYGVYKHGERAGMPKARKRR